MKKNGWAGWNDRKRERERRDGMGRDEEIEGPKKAKEDLSNNTKTQDNHTTGRDTEHHGVPNNIDPSVTPKEETRSKVNNPKSIDSSLTEGTVNQTGQSQGSQGVAASVMDPENITDLPTDCEVHGVSDLNNNE